MLSPVSKCLKVQRKRAEKLIRPSRNPHRRPVLNAVELPMADHGRANGGLIDPIQITHLGEMPKAPFRGDSVCRR
jgi:hypothetical protein